MGKSGESTQPAELEYGDGLGAPDPATPTVTIPRGGLDPWRRGRLPQRRDKAAAVLRDPERRMETAWGAAPETRRGQFPGRPGSWGGCLATRREEGKAKPREGPPVC